MNAKILLGDLALDLERVALGSYRGSGKMVKIFSKEAIERKKELQSLRLKQYIKKFLNNLDSILLQKDLKDVAEDALMHSTLFQNAALAK